MRMKCVMAGTVQEVVDFLAVRACFFPAGATHGAVWDHGTRSAVVWENHGPERVLCWNGTEWVHAVAGHYIARNLLWAPGSQS